jgi:threonine dehydrogenase-like Zn-dependent dehydrogenase
MRIAVIGTGYVGLVSGACFADFGHQVICVDKDESKIAALRRGEIPIFEPGLDDLVAANVKAKRLDFTTDLKGPVAQADVVFIAVGTPSRRGDGHADLSYVYAAAREIAASFPASPSSSLSRPCPSAPAMRSSASSATSIHPQMSWLHRIRNFCARVRPFATSNSLTVS